MLTYYFPRFQASCRVVDTNGHPHLLLTDQQIGIRHYVNVTTLQQELVAKAQSITTGRHPKYQLITTQPVGHLNAGQRFNYLSHLQWQIWVVNDTITIRRWNQLIAKITLTPTSATLQIDHEDNLALVAVIASIIHPDRLTPAPRLTDLIKRVNPWPALPCPSPTKSEFTINRHEHAKH